MTDLEKRAAEIVRYCRSTTAEEAGKFVRLNLLLVFAQGERNALATAGEIIQPPLSTGA